MKKSIVNLFMVLGFVVMVVGLLVEGIVSPLPVSTILFSTPYIAAVLATCFIFAKNGVVKNVGFALGAMAGVYGIVLIVLNAYLVAAVGMILMLLSSVCYFIVLALAFFGFVKRDSVAVRSADVATLLGKYKEMEQDKVITDEEFSQLKAQVLQTLTEKESATLEDLKKWKKLLDQGVISDEEFAAMKAKVFTK